MKDVARSDGRRTVILAQPGLDGLLAALPVLAALAKAGRATSVVADPPLAVLLPLAPGGPAAVDEPGKLRGFDDAFCLDPRLATAVRAWRAGIPRRLGSRGILRSLLLTDAVAAPPRGAPPWDVARALVAAAGLAPAEVDVRLHVPRERIARAEERLARAGLASGTAPRIGVLVTAPAVGRPWPRHADEELVRRLRQDDPRRRLVLLADAATLWRAVRVHEETGKIHPVIGPDLDLAHLAAVLGRLDAVIGPDSAGLRLAAAAGAPTVGVFAPSRRSWSPPGEVSRVVEAPPGALPIDDVVGAVGRLLPSSGG